MLVLRLESSYKLFKNFGRHEDEKYSLTKCLYSRPESILLNENVCYFYLRSLALLKFWLCCDILSATDRFLLIDYLTASISGL